MAILGRTENSNRIRLSGSAPTTAAAIPPINTTFRNVPWTVETMSKAADTSGNVLLWPSMVLDRTLASLILGELLRVREQI